MKKLAVFIAIGLILMVPASFAYAPSDISDHIEVNSYPQITVISKGNTSFNISFYGLAFNIPFLGLKGFAQFEKENWHIVHNGNETVSYSTSLNLQDSLENGDNGSLSDNLNKILGDKKMNVTVFVNISKYSDSSSILDIYNNTSAVNNATIRSLTVNTLEINSSIITHFKLPFPMRISLVQQLSGKLDSNHLLGFSKFAAKLRDKNTAGNGISFGNTGDLNRSYGLYWWMGNYSINNNVMPLMTTLAVKNSSPYLVFVYNIPGNRTNSLQQDPFFTLLGGNLAKIPIVTKTVAKIENYILQNSEYFAAGIIAGTALILVSYTGYRRRRF